MNHSFYLAWKSFFFYRKRNATIILALALILSLPLVLKTSLSQFESKLRQRSQQTPLIIGAKSQAFDLTLHELYFQGKDFRPISMSDKQNIEDMKLAKVIPVYQNFTARGFPLIATEG